MRDGLGSDCALDNIGIEFDAAVKDEALDRRPASNSVVDRFD